MNLFCTGSLYVYVPGLLILYRYKVCKLTLFYYYSLSLPSIYLFERLHSEGKVLVTPLLDTFRTITLPHFGSTCLLVLETHTRKQIITIYPPHPSSRLRGVLLHTLRLGYHLTQAPRFDPKSSHKSRSSYSDQDPVHKDFAYMNLPRDHLRRL